MLWVTGLWLLFDVCRQQELKVYQARRSLEEALTADSVARAAENTQALLEDGLMDAWIRLAGLSVHVYDIKYLRRTSKHLSPGGRVWYRNTLINSSWSIRNEELLALIWSIKWCHWIEIKALWYAFFYMCTDNMFKWPSLPCSSL